VYAIDVGIAFVACYVCVLCLYYMRVAVCCVVFDMRVYCLYCM